MTRRWSGSRWSIELRRVDQGEQQLLQLRDADNDQAELQLEVEEAATLSGALRGRRYRRGFRVIDLRHHAGLEVSFTGDLVNIAALVDPTGTIADIHEQHGALALMSAVHGLATREGLRAGMGQLPAGIQAVDLWIPRHVARELASALVEPRTPN